MHPTVDSGWKLDETQLPDEGGRWAWYIRVNDRDYRCSSGLYPFQPTEHTINLNTELRDPPIWRRGTYRVSYVMKNLDLVHVDDASIRRRLKELESNIIHFEIAEDGV